MKYVVVLLFISISLYAQDFNKLDKDGKLQGVFKIKHGDESTFIAERAEAPSEPIPEPPSYRDKWRRRW